MRELFDSETGTEPAVVIGMKDGTVLSDSYWKILAVPVSEEEWNELLSPWPADAVFRGSAPFAGRADALIEELTDAVSSFAGDRKPVILGYSLAGLFSLYWCTKSSLFSGCASVSGSLWYPHLESYLKEHPVRCEHVYFSLGDAEKNSRNRILASVEERTEAMASLVSEYAETIFERNEGGHFAEEAPRMKKALDWLKAKRL